MCERYVSSFLNRTEKNLKIVLGRKTRVVIVEKNDG